MKILYSTSDRIGGDSQARRIIKHLPQHEIKLAAYSQSSQSFKYIDWTLDALKYNKSNIRHTWKIEEFLDHREYFPNVNIDNLKKFLLDVIDFEPDLIISDYEPISGLIAKKIGCELWYCSPLHLLNALNVKSNNFIYSHQMHHEKKTFSRHFVKPNRVFIYSPFVDIIDEKQIIPGYELVRPYYYESENNNGNLAVLNDNNRYNVLNKILYCSDNNFNVIKQFECAEDDYIKLLNNSDALLCCGETSMIADALYSGKKLLISPNMKDIESLINANFCREYGLGFDLSQIELMEKFAVDQINKTMKYEIQCYIEKKEIKQLHEYL